jgi:hypothetical protein
MLPTTYQNNISKVLEAGNYGIRISAPNVDVTQARDADLVFSSAWPSLQEVSVNVITSTSPIAHGLKFPPFALQWSNKTGGEVVSFRACDVDATNVYPTSNMHTVVVYNLDISKDIEYPVTSTKTYSRQYDPNYGIKVVKAGRNITSTDLRDFILHSRCQSPLVLAVKTQTTYNSQNDSILTQPGGVVQYTQALGYPTMNFGYVKGQTADSNRYYAAPMYSQSYPRLFSNGTASYVQWVSSLGSSGASVVILRNPFFATTYNEVVF